MVLVEGCTDYTGNLIELNLKANQIFGLPNGECRDHEFLTASGRCSHSSLKHVVEDDVFNNYRSNPDSLDFSFYDKNSEMKTVIYDWVGPCTFLYESDHSLCGCWYSEWLYKTEYDYGLEVYKFQRKEDADLFILLLGTNFNKAHTITEKEYVKHCNKKR